MFKSLVLAGLGLGVAFSSPVAEPQYGTAPKATSTFAIKPSPVASTAPAAGVKLPFDKVIIFGDNLSDRGNGSADHLLNGNPEWVYGYYTWTNGLVAADQLSRNLGLKIVYDYAYGNTVGGQNFGALISPVLVRSNSGVPSVQDQIANFTRGPFHAQAGNKSLHFVWGGNNDVVLGLAQPNQPFLTPYYPASATTNTQFTTALAQQITNQVQTLITSGANNIFVPNIYNRHVAPVVKRFLTNDTNIINNYGVLIQQANTKLQANLKALATKTGKKIVYYDSFSFMMNIWNNPRAYGFTMTTFGNDICDRSFVDPVPGINSFAWCFQYGHANDYYWVEYTDPTAKMHSLLAADMARVIQSSTWL